jgi:hypothetical protein
VVIFADVAAWGFDSKDFEIYQNRNIKPQIKVQNPWEPLIDSLHQASNY